MIGDYVVTKGKRGWGTAYLIVGLRLVRRLRRDTTERRYTLKVQPDQIVQDALRCDPWILHWYARVKKAVAKPTVRFHRSV
jgi:hypothetical protein